MPSHELERLVGALAYLLLSKDGYFTEEYIQKLLFIALYIKEIKEQEGRTLTVLDDVGMRLVPDYKLTLSGMFSPSVSNAIAKLQVDGTLEKEDEYTFIDRDIERLRARYESLDEKVKRRLKDAVERYSQLSIDEIQSKINEMLGLNKLVYGMSLGMRFIDIVNAFARLTSKKKS